MATTNHAFCDCGRDHKWDKPSPGALTICRCGRVLEPQTEAEHLEKRERHRAALKLMTGAHPCSCLLGSRTDNDGCMFGRST